MVFGNKKWLAARLDELERAVEVIHTDRGPVEFKRQGSPLHARFSWNPGRL